VPVITISPLKVLIVLVVALLLLGPDKVPQAARQIGAGWSAFRRFRQRMEEEIRETVPDLPAAHEIVRAVRSPMSFLDNLADLHGDDGTKSDGTTSKAADGSINDTTTAVAGDALTTNGATSDSHRCGRDRRCRHDQGCRHDRRGSRSPGGDRGRAGPGRGHGHRIRRPADGRGARDGREATRGTPGGGRACLRVHRPRRPEHELIALTELLRTKRGDPS
jgi:TatA/E family protein of Tat protein translocase